MQKCVVETIDEIWNEVLAGEKLPTLMLLGFSPEGVWESKITNFVLTVEKEDIDEKPFLSFVSNFDWVINRKSFHVQTNITISKMRLTFFNHNYFFYVGGMRIEERVFEVHALGENCVVMNSAWTIDPFLRSLHRKAYEVYLKKK